MVDESALTVAGKMEAIATVLKDSGRAQSPTDDTHPLAEEHLQCRRSAAVRQDHGDYIRLFLAGVKPLSGCCWCGDTSFHAGRSAIERLAIARGIDNDELLPTIEQCADMLHYLSCIESASQKLCYGCGGGGEHCGHSVVLDFIRDLMRDHLRP